MTDPDALKRKLDEIESAPPAERGPLHRFGRMAVGISERAFVPDPATGKNTRVAFDPATHAPDELRNFVAFTVIPVDPRFRAIEREVLERTKEFNLTRASIQAAGRRLSDLDGSYVHVCFEPNEAELGTHTGRDGVRRVSTYLKLVETFDDEDACREAADAFFKRGGGAPDEGGASTPPTDTTTPANGWTEAERAERNTLLGFLAPLATGKTYDQFVAAIGADARLSRYFKPTDEDVVAVLTRVGITPPAPET